MRHLLPGAAAPASSRGRGLCALTRSTRRMRCGEIFRRFSVQRPEPKGELDIGQRLHSARRSGAVGASDRRQRQQGDAAAIRNRRHAAKDAGARRGRGRRPYPHDRPVAQQGEECDRALRGADPRPWRQGARESRPVDELPGVGARPPTSCSTWHSASRPWPSTRIFSGSATALGWRPARRRRRSNQLVKGHTGAILRHAHHWLILHGRYICKARRPECERCIIADICKAAVKTSAIPAPLVEWAPLGPGFDVDQ